MAESADEKFDRIVAADEAERRRELLLAVEEVNRRVCDSQAESVSIEGMGFKGKATGPGLLTGHGTIYAALGIMVFLTIAYMIRDHDLKAYDRAQVLIEQQRKILEATNEIPYILTLTDDERKALRLDMPESLRKKAGR